MSTLRYYTKYRKNEGIVMSPDELLSLYFYGITIESQDGTQINTDTIRAQIKMAQSEVEKYLEVRLQRKFIEQDISYYTNDYWNNYPILRLKLPIVEPLTLIGKLNTIEQIKYPKDWLNTKSDSEGKYHKTLRVIPYGSSGGGSSGTVVLSGVTAMYGMQGLGNIPNYFTVQYVTGYNSDELPFDLVDLVGKYAAIRLFHIGGDLILGSGIASLSLGIDSISQSVSTTSSATNAGYGSRIIGYLKDIESHSKKLKQFYKSINFTSL
jgi:hypothetical protein